MYYNTPSSNCLTVITIVAFTHLVVIDYDSGGFVPDLYSKQVNICTGCKLLVNRGEHKSILPIAIYSARTLIFSFVACYNKPIVVVTVKVEVGHFELELRFPSGYFSSFELHPLIS